MTDTSNAYIDKVLNSAPFADQQAGVPQMCNLIKALRNERDGEKEARHKAEAALRDKDSGMETLFDLLRLHGVDYSHLIS